MDDLSFAFLFDDGSLTMTGRQLKCCYFPKREADTEISNMVGINFIF
jgi:hypothetical protein